MIISANGGLHLATTVLERTIKMSTEDEEERDENLHTFAMSFILAGLVCIVGTHNLPGDLPMQLYNELSEKLKAAMEEKLKELLVLKAKVDDVVKNN
jgi:hypothetical protein